MTKSRLKIKHIEKVHDDSSLWLWVGGGLLFMCIGIVWSAVSFISFVKSFL